MAFWQDEFNNWVSAWAALQDLVPQVSGDVVTMGARQVTGWPGDAASAQAAQLGSGSELVLVTEDPVGAAEFGQSQGLRETNRAVLLRAETENLDLVPHLPADANLADAPLENYDVVEVALFDRPAGSGRLRLADGLAVVSTLAVDDGNEDLRHALELAMMAELGEEAFTHGADALYLIAGAEQAERFAGVDGWSKAAEILSFSK
ncbi:hypothetical protein [Arthrobacter sp. H35-D1]|uniref:hypothetical protein n=1 Tax=Arthrobacter sp. H35-D1 TaxID=3046202 RepID=UPI0024B9AACB|nr:hypothetical protein [Arthrobacter sp. H35-D1]MDJ0311718.1 hypothetical protein [Arthrobacter sp. H35-D1]